MTNFTVGTLSGSADLVTDAGDPSFAKLHITCPAGDSTNAAQLSLEDSGKVKIEVHVYPGTHVVVVDGGVVYDSAA